MKKLPNLGYLSVLLSVILIVFVYSQLPLYESSIVQFTKDNPYLAPLIIILWRVIAIVIPPLPGGIVSYALIPILGWFLSYVYATIGVMLGVSIAFFIARRYREPLLKRFLSLQDLHRWQAKLSNKTEFMTFLGIRLSTGAILDFISYAAGLSTLSFRRFFFITLLSEIPHVLSFYLGEKVYKLFAEKQVILGIILVISICLTLYFIKIPAFLAKNNEAKK